MVLGHVTHAFGLTAGDEQSSRAYELSSNANELLPKADELQPNTAGRRAACSILAGQAA